MSQPTTPNKDNDAFGAFAGIVILIVILSIVFGLTTPNVSSNDAIETEAETEIADVDEATAEVTEAIVVADEPTEAPTQTVVVAATDVPDTDEPTEAPTQTVVVAATDVPDTDEATEEVAENATEAAVADAETTSSDYDPEMVANGEQMFIVCTACHGPDGRGIPGLGKDLVAGEFATTATDDELHAVILNGRPIWDAANTTMVDMPPKGGNPALTDEDIDAIVAYVRSLQSSTDGASVGDGTDEVSEEPTEEVTEVVAADAEAASGDYDPEMVAHGEQLFIVCTACHGPDGRGLPGLGKDLVAGEFATTATDEELHAVILNGRPIWDAANTTMVDMPPKGGNPALTDEDIDAIVAYIRSLQTP